MVLEASNRMAPLMAVSFLRSLHKNISECSGDSCNLLGILGHKTGKVPYLYSIFPDVGSNMTHRSFHFRSCLKEDHKSSEDENVG
jgi:hypothetical protein